MDDNDEHAAAAPHALPWLDDERAALRRRRERAGSPPEAPTVGLALSGGGVRSATFGLGLLRGLAQHGLLARVDYLSTVSGGGFIGAMFGRLVSRLGIADAQTLLARPESPLLDWLRRNGRYLTPAGSRDLGIAIVSYLRAMIAIHGESLLTGLVFAVLVMAPHLAVLAGDRFETAHWEAWQTLWWPLALALWLLLAPGLMAAYWVARDAPDPNVMHARPPRRDLVFLALYGLALMATTAVALRHLHGLPLARGQGGSVLAVCALLVGWSCFAGLVATPLRLALAHEPHQLAVARRRSELTGRLRGVTRAAALLALLGLLDVGSWWLLEGLQAGEVSVWGGVGLGGFVVLVLRAFAQPLQQFVAKADAGALRSWGTRALHAAGVLGLLLLLTAWLVAAQWLVFTPEPLVALRDLSPGVRATGLLALGLLWLVLTAGNEQMANASSLHSFYRGRLTRAYLSVGNPLRGLATLADEPQAPPESRQRDVTKVLASDDLDMRDHRPEAEGGPLHLANACLNQTRDDDSELYNADRKGTLVTASARGLEIGHRFAVPMPPKQEGVGAASSASAGGDEIGTLGRWVAISGAAAAPGSGSYTARGWALLLFFLGVRLGYWMRAPVAPSGGWPRHIAFWWRAAVKPLMLACEASATFFGCARPWWYLSDGGHFDNTGVYPLLVRRVDFIILADAGADPDYDFADLENLVRKARIDLGAEIEFYTREEAQQQLFANAPTDLVTVLSPEDMADNHSTRGVMLARVRYPADAHGVRQESTLLVVKPNLHDALDLDLLAYAERHADFPHEATSDQSFDEAQWESYQRLGEDFGEALAPAWLDQLPRWSVRHDHPLTISARLHAAANVKSEPEAVPLWRRTASTTRAAAIGTTLGLGFSGTLLLSLWQVGEAVKQGREADRAEARRLFGEVSKGVAELDGTPCPKLAPHVGPQLLNLRDLAEGERLAKLEREAVQLLVERVQAECHPGPGESTASTTAASAARCPRPRALAALCAQLDKPPSSGALSYWHPALQSSITLTSLWQWATGPAPLAAEDVPREARAAVAAAAQGAASGAASAVASPAAVPPAPVPAPGGDAGAASAVAPAPSPPSPSPPAAPAPSIALAACAAPGAPVQLFIEIYDESTRGAAEALARDLQTRGAAAALQIAPVENLTRSAELRQQRRPVPWPQPTLLVHHPDDLACAQQLAGVLQQQRLLPDFGTHDDSVWIRESPRSLRSRRGAIDLFLPSLEGGQARSGW